ncbi:hypothetical protein K438DRAFT_1649259, partial [Mycena galopus ATCC 62051]
HFMDAKREVYGRLVQCRTGHAFIGDYAKFVPMERIGCQCGERFQTREHILRECENYAQHRDLLRDASPELSLPEILGTEKGLQALDARQSLWRWRTKRTANTSERRKDGDGPGGEEVEGSDGSDGEDD